MTKDHYELLDCGHQNNLLLAGNKSGVCPKGCEKPKILEVVRIDVQLAGIEETIKGD